MQALLIRIWIFLLLAAPALCQAADPAAGTQTAHSLQIDTDDDQQPTTLRYWLYLPKNYSEDSPVPLMLFLHGAGERGEDLEKVKIWGPPKLVAEGQNMPFLIVSPQSPIKKDVPIEDHWDARQLIELVDHVANRYAVDKSRMYVTGLSMGGYGTWRLAAKYPKVFAAALPVCGGGHPEWAEALKNVPIWTFHGDEDRVVLLQRSEQMVEAVNQAGGNAKLTVYPGVGHNSWSQTYANEEAYEWLLSHQRQK